MASDLERDVSCQFPQVRFGADSLDDKCRQLCDALEAAYYGSWARGRSATFLTFTSGNKALFDKLHGGIWHLRTLYFKSINDSLPPEQRADEASWRYDCDVQSGLIVNDRVEEARRWLRDNLSLSEETTLRNAFASLISKPVATRLPRS